MKPSHEQKRLQAAIVKAAVRIDKKIAALHSAGSSQSRSTSKATAKEEHAQHSQQALLKKVAKRFIAAYKAAEDEEHEGKKGGASRQSSKLAMVTPPRGNPARSNAPLTVGDRVERKMVAGKTWQHPVFWIVISIFIVVGCLVALVGYRVVRQNAKVGDGYSRIDSLDAGDVEKLMDVLTEDSDSELEPEFDAASIVRKHPGAAPVHGAASVL